MKLLNLWTKQYGINMTKKNFSRYRKLTLTIITLTLGSISYPTLADKIDFSLGYYVGQNQYTANQDKNVHALSFSSTYKFNKQQVKLSSSYNRLKQDNNAQNNKNSGLGDTLIAYKRIYNLKKNKQLIEIQSKIKLATADEKKGLGTGKTDYELASTFFHRINQNWIFAKAAHKWRGSSNKYAMNNSLSGAIGLSLRHSSTLTYGSLLEYHQASAETNFDRKEIMIYLSHKSSAKLKFTTYLVRGFSAKQSKWAGGIQLTHSLSLD